MEKKSIKRCRSDQVFIHQAYVVKNTDVITRNIFQTCYF